MPQLIIPIVLMWLGAGIFAQSEKATVNFYSRDSLLITADDYVRIDTLPYLVLIHEQNSSRGEFINIVDRFQKMNFNCLAVDVRNGGNSNVLGNETANRCRTEGLDRSANAIEEDIQAAVRYASEKSGQNVILLGAGANGSLALKVAKEQDEVRAVIALSPGEFFLPGLNIEDTIAGLQKPVLITSSKLEFPYSKQLVSKIEEDYKSVFTPENNEGDRGTRALLPENSSNGEYWLAILFFFKDLQ